MTRGGPAGALSRARDDIPPPPSAPHQDTAFPNETLPASRLAPCQTNFTKAADKFSPSARDSPPSAPAFAIAALVPPTPALNFAMREWRSRIAEINSAYAKSKPPTAETSFACVKPVSTTAKPFPPCAELNFATVKLKSAYAKFGAGVAKLGAGVVFRPLQLGGASVIASRGPHPGPCMLLSIFLVWR